MGEVALLKGGEEKDSTGEEGIFVADVRVWIDEKQGRSKRSSRT